MARSKVLEEVAKQNEDAAMAAAAQEAVLAFNKARLLKSQRYKERRDLLGVLLQDDCNYTFEEVDGIIKNFMEGKVN